MTKTLSLTAAPLLTASIGRQPLRFFRTPLDDGRPDLPWHAVDDLHRCLGLDRNQRRFFLHTMRDSQWLVRTIATDSGLVTVAPHFMAQGAINAFVEMGQISATIRADYDRAGAEALQKLMAAAGVPPFGSDAWFCWMKAALHRWDEDA